MQQIVRCILRKTLFVLDLPSKLFESSFTFLSYPPRTSTIMFVCWTLKPSFLSISSLLTVLHFSVLRVSVSRKLGHAISITLITFSLLSVTTRSGLLLSSSGRLSLETVQSHSEPEPDSAVRNLNTFCAAVWMETVLAVFETITKLSCKCGRNEAH